MVSMVFNLACFERYGSEYLVCEWPLSGVTPDEVRQHFHLGPNEYPGDCLPVKREHVHWLEQLLNVELDLTNYEYFVEATAS